MTTPQPVRIEHQDRTIDINAYKEIFYENLLTSIMEDIMGPDDVYAKPDDKTSYYSPFYLDRYKKLSDLFKTLPDFVAEQVILEHISFNYDHDDACYCFINCSDLFYWAHADGEKIDHTDFDGLKECLDQSKQNGHLLYCCKKRGMRPQKPYYKFFSPEEALLFDATGPERNV